MIYVIRTLKIIEYIWKKSYRFKNDIFLKISLSLQDLTQRFSAFITQASQVVTVALLIGYEMHKNIYTDILSGPLKQIKLEVRNRGEVVVLWNMPERAGLHYSTLSMVKWSQDTNGMVWVEKFHRTGKHYASARSLLFLFSFVFCFCFFMILFFPSLPLQ